MAKTLIREFERYPVKNVIPLSERCVVSAVANGKNYFPSSVVLSFLIFNRMPFKSSRVKPPTFMMVFEMKSTAIMLMKRIRVPLYCCKSLSRVT